MAGEAPEFGEIPKTLSGVPSLSPAEDTGALQVGSPQTPVPSCQGLRPSWGHALRLADLSGPWLGPGEPDSLSPRPSLLLPATGCHRSQCLSQTSSSPVCLSPSPLGTPVEVSTACSWNMCAQTRSWALTLAGGIPSGALSRHRRAVGLLLGWCRLAGTHDCHRVRPPASLI